LNAPPLEIVRLRRRKGGFSRREMKRSEKMERYRETGIQRNYMKE